MAALFRPDHLSAGTFSPAPGYCGAPQGPLFVSPSPPSAVLSSVLPLSAGPLALGQPLSAPFSVSPSRQLSRGPGRKSGKDRRVSGRIGGVETSSSSSEGETENSDFPRHLPPSRMDIRALLRPQGPRVVFGDYVYPPVGKGEKSPSQSGSFATNSENETESASDSGGNSEPESSQGFFNYEQGKHFSGEKCDFRVGCHFGSK